MLPILAPDFKISYIYNKVNTSTTTLTIKVLYSFISILPICCPIFFVQSSFFIFLFINKENAWATTIINNPNDIYVNELNEKFIFHIFEPAIANMVAKININIEKFVGDIKSLLLIL